MIDRSAVLSEASTALAKLSPAAAVATVSASGWSLQDWVYVVTIAYVLMQGAHLGWKWIREWRAARATA
jgi:hypothetical protein